MKTKAELEQEIKRLNKELFYKNEQIEVLNYLCDSQEAELKALRSGRNNADETTADLVGKLNPLQGEKFDQKERAKTLNAKKREQRQPYLKIYAEWRAEGVKQSEARRDIRALILKETGEEIPKKTIINKFK